MDYTEFCRHVRKAGLSLAEFATLLGVKSNSVTNYSSKGTVPTSYAIIAVFLGDAGDRHVNFRQLLSIHGALPKLNAQESIAQIDEYRSRVSGLKK